MPQLRGSLSGANVFGWRGGWHTTQLLGFSRWIYLQPFFNRSSRFNHIMSLSSIRRRLLADRAAEPPSNDDSATQPPGYTRPLSRRRDLPFDGSPHEQIVRSARDKCPLQVYFWPRAAEAPARGIVLLLHGVRAHSRLTWLAKRPPSLGHLPTPISRIHPYIDRTGSSGSAAIDWADWQGQLTLPQLNNACNGIVRDAFARARVQAKSPEVEVSPASTTCTVGITNDSRSLGYTDATEEEKETQLFYEGSWIEAINELGYDVFGMDLRGHGKSGGERCSVDEFEDYCIDVESVIKEAIWTRFAPRAGVTRPKLYVVGVSLSTLIVCKLLQKPKTRQLHIHACALISGFLKEGEKFSRRPIRTFLRLLVHLRHFLPNVPLHLPKKPETQGPLWQMKFGDYDPYLCKRSFKVKMIGTCVAALQDFDDTKAQLVAEKACKHLKMFHNYLDLVNPIDGSMEPLSWLMEHSDGMDVQCIIFNGQHMRPEHSKLWHPNVEWDTMPLDLGHTLITDKDNIYVFDHFLKWLMES